jgi:hypothetical protein
MWLRWWADAGLATYGAAMATHTSNLRTSGGRGAQRVFGQR